MNKNLSGDPHKIKEMAGMLKALGHPARVNIMWMLCRSGEGRLTVKSIYECLNLPQPVISRHLGILRATGLVKRHAAGHLAFYEPAGDGDLVAKLINCFKTIH